MFIKNGGFRKNFTHIISYVPPFILNQPLSGNVFSGQDYTFRFKVRGSRPLKYQWYKNNFPLLNQTNNELSLTNINQTDEAYYYCRVSNNRNYLISNSVPLSVINSIYIVTDPSSVVSYEGTNVLLQVSAYGTNPLTYKWYKNNILYPDSTSKNLYINNINLQNEGNYYVVVSNQFGSATSLSASIKLIDKLVITTQPESLTTNVNDNTHFSLSCIGTFPIDYQWRKNNTQYTELLYNNDGSISLDINSTQLTDAAYYDCVISNSYESITSKKVYLQVNEKPVFILNPLSAELPIAETVTFTVNTSGTQPITYQWVRTDTGNILNENSKTYTIPSIKLDDQAQYACVATNLVGSTTSTYAELSVIQSDLITSLNEPYEFILLDQNVYWSP